MLNEFLRKSYTVSSSHMFSCLTTLIPYRCPWQNIIPNRNPCSVDVLLAGLGLAGHLEENYGHMFRTLALKIIYICWLSTRNSNVTGEGANTVFLLVRDLWVAIVKLFLAKANCYENWLSRSGDSHEEICWGRKATSQHLSLPQEPWEDLQKLETLLQQFYLPR